MKKYFCDVCGVEMADCRDAMPDPDGPAIELCGLEDLCPRCEGLVQKLNVPDLILGELRRLVTAKPEKPEPPVPAPVLRGRWVKEKRTILAAVESYRREHGPGSITALAKLARVDEGALRDMISCEKVPLTTWWQWARRCA